MLSAHPDGRALSVLLTEASPAFTYLGEDGGGSVCRLHCEVIVGFLLCIKGFGNNDRAGALVNIEVTVIVATWLKLGQTEVLEQVIQ